MDDRTTNPDDDSSAPMSNSDSYGYGSDTLASPDSPHENPVLMPNKVEPRLPVIVEKGGLIKDILANPGSGRLHEQRAYEYGLAYTKPNLIKPVIVGGYIRDERPVDYDIEAEARSAIPALHHETIHCSVSGKFIDDAIFKEGNILLEILQNAEPKDSKGTWFDLEFFAAGKWRQVTTEISKFNDNQIEALRILDNGKGYMPKDMTTLGGGKRDDPESAGRFGSGMKISDRSALGRGMVVTRYSRNWRAEPFLEPVVTSHGHDDTVGYNVEYLPQVYRGSVVEYRNLTPGVIRAVRNISQTYLPLDKTFPSRLLIHTLAGLILQPNSPSGEVMVNGRSYTLTTQTKHPLMFSYDLQNCTIDDQNRHYVDTGKATINMNEIWEKTEDLALFKKLINKAKKGEKVHEHDMPGLSQATPTFRQAIKECYDLKNIDAVYIDDGKLSEKEKISLARKGYVSINLGESRFITETLAQAGVLPGQKLLEQITKAFYLNIDHNDFKDEPFSATVCRGIFLLERMAKEQDKAMEIKILFEDQETGEVTEMTYGEFKQKSYLNLRMKTPTAIKVTVKGAKVPGADEARYWFDNSQPAWTKQFEPFIASCYIAGADGSVHYKSHELSCGKHDNRPTIRVREWPHVEPSELEVFINIENVNQAKDLRHLDMYSLNLDKDYKPFEKTSAGDVVSLKDGHIYEEGIRRFSVKYKSLLSYDLPNKAKGDDIGKDIRKILALAKNPEIPLAILKKTKEEDDSAKYYMEYLASITDPEIKANWVKAFVKVYGENTVLYNLADPKTSKLIEAVGESSGLKVVRLESNLTTTLVNCGVKTLSEATQVAKIKEYRPNPLKEAFLEIAHVADVAISQALGPFDGSIKPTIKLVTEVQNAYGQNIRTGQGYLDPTLSNRTIYMFADAVTNKNIDQVVTFILNKKIEVYRNSMNEDDYLQFRSRVIGIAERSLTTINFMSRVRGKMFKKGENVAELVELTLKEIAKSETDAEETLVIQKPKPKAKPLPYGEWTRRFGLKAAKATTSLAILATLGGGLLYGGKAAYDVASNSEFLKKLGKKIAKDSEDLPGGFHRPNVGGTELIGVSIERSHPGGSPEGAREYMRQMQARFITEPPLRWGYFMSERAENKYTGKAWENDQNAPQFEDQNYSSHERFAHYQVAGGEKTVNIRTRAGGFIDPKSIKLLKPDGSLSDALIAQKLPNGEYDIKILDSSADIVFYQTLSPSNWHETANQITDDDFSKLDQKSYEYYTSTPQIDIDKVRFKSELFPQISTLREFVDYLKTLKPIDRVNTIIAVVHKMRYTRTERTETAFAKFHNNALPEKDFLEFVLNSDQLENPGDGDCDVQNSVFALLARYAGIPSKLDFVITNKGVGHGPASIFLPKIGWILSDTMGNRVLQESVNEQDNFIDDREEKDTVNTEEEARQRLIENIRRRTEYDARKCYEVEPKQ